MDGDATFRQMTVEHLGIDASDGDLAAFVGACRMYQMVEGKDDREVTDWMWNNGNWGPRVEQYWRRSDDEEESQK